MSSVELTLRKAGNYHKVGREGGGEGGRGGGRGGRTMIDGYVHHLLLYTVLPLPASFFTSFLLPIAHSSASSAWLA